MEAVAEQYERNQLAWEIDPDRLNLAAVRGAFIKKITKDFLDVLGHYGRFRLIPDQQLSSLLKQWIKEYNEQTYRQSTFFTPETELKFNPDNFDIIPSNMVSQTKIIHMRFCRYLCSVILMNTIPTLQLAQFPVNEYSMLVLDRFFSCCNDSFWLQCFRCSFSKFYSVKLYFCYP